MISHILEVVGHDIRVALKTLVRAPAFSLVAVATLAIGIGCTTAAFSVLDTAVWRGLPYERSELLQTVFERSDDGGDFAGRYVREAHSAVSIAGCQSIGTWPG